MLRLTINFVKSYWNRSFKALVRYCVRWVLLFHNIFPSTNVPCLPAFYIVMPLTCCFVVTHIWWLFMKQRQPHCPASSVNCAIIGCCYQGLCLEVLLWSPRIALIDGGDRAPVAERPCRHIKSPWISAPWSAFIWEGLVIDRGLRHVVASCCGHIFGSSSSPASYELFFLALWTYPPSRVLGPSLWC